MKLSDKEFEKLLESEEKHSFNKTFEFRGEKSSVKAPVRRLTAVAVAALLAVCMIAASVFIAVKMSGGKAPEPPAGETAEQTEKTTVEVFESKPGNYAAAKFVSLADTSATAYTVYGSSYYGNLQEYRKAAASLNAFFDKLTANLIDGSESGVVSPVNIYMALSLLAECTEGNSRKQILDVLGVADMEELREQAKLIWLYNSKDDEYGRSLLANSVWLSSDLPVKELCVNYLKNDHYASTFNGDFTDNNYVTALKQWLSDQTNGLLDDCINELEIPADTVAVLASTLYYKTRWDNEYRETESGTFKGKNGNTDCTFNKKTDNGSYIYKGDGFTAYAESLSDGNTMWFFLPDEGKSTSDVIKSGVTAFISGSKTSTQYNVTIRMPDFDVDYNESIKEKLALLGIIDCMDITKADFSALSDDDSVFLGEAVHAARFKADKEGVEGAAYTVMILEGMGEVFGIQEYDFTLDKPFVFAVVNGGVPLFVGCVNDPG